MACAVGIRLTIILYISTISLSLRKISIPESLVINSSTIFLESIEVRRFGVHSINGATCKLVDTCPLVGIVFIAALVEEESRTYDIVAVRKFLDTVGDERSVEIEIPLKVGISDDIHAELEFETIVLHLTDIHQHRGVVAIAERTIRERENVVIDKVRVALIEETEAKAEAVVEERTFEGDVKCLGSLPLKVGSSDLRRDQVTCASPIIEVHISVVAGSGVVTYRTVSETEFQIVDPIDIVHKLLLRDNPACADRPESTPAVVGMELRRPVTVDRELGEVFLIVVITHAAEVRLSSIVIDALSPERSLLEVREDRHIVNLLTGHTDIRILSACLEVLVEQESVDMVQAIFVAPVKLLSESVAIA